MPTAAVEPTGAVTVAVFLGPGKIALGLEQPFAPMPHGRLHHDEQIELLGLGFCRDFKGKLALVVGGAG